MKRIPSGFSMIEVLVTTVILAVGLLGIAALQVVSSKYVTSGLHRSQAAALSMEMIERMRANLDLARLGSYDFGSLPSYTTNCTGVAANCTALEMREHDLRVWSARVLAMLPSAGASILTTNPSPAHPDASRISITLRWQENVDKDGDPIFAEQQFVFDLHGVKT